MRKRDCILPSETLQKLAKAMVAAAKDSNLDVDVYWDVTKNTLVTRINGVLK